MLTLSFKLDHFSVMEKLSNGLAYKKVWINWKKKFYKSAGYYGKSKTFFFRYSSLVCWLDDRDSHWPLNFFHFSIGYIHRDIM